MADHSLAVTSDIRSPSLSEPEYEAICAAVMETARGRWFLAEYARRNRNADTRVVLEAVERLESVMRRDHATQSSMPDDLGDMARAVARAKADIAAITPQGDNTAHKLVAVMAALDQLEGRVAAMRAAQEALPEAPPVILPDDGISLVLDIMAEKVEDEPPMAPALTLVVTSEEPQREPPRRIVPSWAMPAPVTRRQTPTGPLAPILMLTDEERIALFT